MGNITNIRVTEVADPKGGRNKIREGDPVKVSPSSPGRRDGFVGTFRYAVVDSDTQQVVYFEVVGAPGKRCPASRSFTPDRITRVRRTAVTTHHS